MRARELNKSHAAYKKGRRVTRSAYDSSGQRPSGMFTSGAAWGRRTGEASEATALPEFRGFTTEKFLTS